MIEHVNRNASLTRTLATVTTAGAVSATQTTGVPIPDAPNGVVFVLDVTSAATDVGDTLDVKVQTTLDGSAWIDVCYFTQVLGNGGAKRHVGKICASTAVTMFENGTALTAGNVRHILGNQYRVSYVVVDADADSAFTFTVTATPL